MMEVKNMATQTKESPVRTEPELEQQKTSGAKQTIQKDLSKNAGFLAIIAVLIAIFGGSRLFVSIENYFDIIYHTRPRDVIRQNIMALAMLLLFVILVPLMVFASSIPALVQSILKATP